MDLLRRPAPARRPVLVGCAVAASLFPFLGTIVYTILRPPEFIEDRKERELEIRASELRVRQLDEQSCPNCGYPVERSYLRCPECQARLKDPCPTCEKPIDPRWAMCPYCETRSASARPSAARGPAAASAPTASHRRGMRRRQPSSLASSGRSARRPARRARDGRAGKAPEAPLEVGCPKDDAPRPKTEKQSTNSAPADETAEREPARSRSSNSEKVGACGICGTDLHIADGEFPPTPYPIVPGHEFAGSVVALGTGVDTGLAEGDRVAVDPSLFCGYCAPCRAGRGNLCANWGATGDTVDGAFAELVAVPARNCYRMPEDTTWQQGAMVEPVSCAVHGVRRLGVEVGESLLVVGAGPMGLLLTQLLVRSGASVTVVDRNAARLPLAEKLCASRVAGSVAESTAHSSTPPRT